MTTFNLIVRGAQARNVKVSTSQSGSAESDGILPMDQSMGLVASNRSFRFEVDTAETSAVRLEIDDYDFAFWPSDVSSAHPILLEGPGIAITLGDDLRTFEDVTLARRLTGGESALEKIAGEQEHSYERATEFGRKMQGPTWLGVSRDIRIFSHSFRGIGAGGHSERLWDWVAPQMHGEPVRITEADNASVRYQYMLGRGIGPRVDITRRLRDGTLPILDTRICDGGIIYESTSLVGFEQSELTSASNAGTHYLLADGYSDGHMFTPAQESMFSALEQAYDPTETTVFYSRIVATNVGVAPRFAYIALPAPYVRDANRPVPYTFDGTLGLGEFDADRVFLVALMDGVPLSHEESAILLQPGESRTFDIRIPHTPITRRRGQDLGRRSFSEIEASVVEYWREKLRSAARLSLPEVRVGEMVAAGLLHLDLVAYGSEPEGTLAPTIGVYAPIGSESAPIIQAFDSFGRPDLARRALQYFIDKQHDDGFMQNFNGYMLETEAFLWSMGEHFRYTQDLEWLDTVADSIRAAVEYILRNRKLRVAEGDVRGLVVGKTADPDDLFASFMLNGYAYLGLSRAAEMMASINLEVADAWRNEATSFRDDIRSAFFEAVAMSPVLPLSDGTWVRSAPPWPGLQGPIALDRSGLKRFTHGSSNARDTLLGPLWLVIQEVLDPDEAIVEDMLKYHADLFFDENTALSQPYYSPHPLIHLRSNQRLAFLRGFYTMFATLADYETYSFWEHYFHVSPHKTHEEAWFLMQTRWMLWLEKGDELSLLPGLPEAWLTIQSPIVLKGARSYFGAFDLRVDVSDSGRQIAIDFEGDPSRLPDKVSVHLPSHGTTPKSVSAGTYDRGNETLYLEVKAGRATTVLTY